MSSSTSGRRRFRGVGAVIAVTGVLVILLGALGGAGYARSAVSTVVSTIRHNGIASGHQGRSLQSADQAQYTGEKPAVSPPPPPPKSPQLTPGGETKKVGGPPSTAGLPFTGTSLLLPLLIGLGLVGAGLALRRGARRDPSES